MKKMSKKILSAIMALTMVVTILPSFAVFADTSVKWTAVASSDFSNVSASQSTNFTPNQYNNLGQKITWNAYTYSGSLTTESDALYVPDGFMRIANYDQGTTTPLTGVTSFKMDLGFRFYNDNSNSVTTDGTYYLFKYFVYNSIYQNAGDRGAQEYCALAQDAHGRIISWNDKGYYNTQSNNYNDKAIATSSSLLTSGKNYHYVIEYVQDTYLRAYVTDDNGVVIEEIINTKNQNNSNNSDTLFNCINTGLRDGIQSIYLGAHKGISGKDMWMQGLEYRNITFYSGEKVSQDDSTSNSKYLLTYFTGNNAEGEQLRFAVSTDGLNYKPLNNAMPIWTGANQSITSYPSGGEQGIAVSKHIRDPYIFKGANGKYYVLATDLDTSVAFSNNSKMLVWELDNLSDIDTTTPWAIDTQEWKTTLALNSSGEYDTDNPDVKRAWAPQAIYDPAEGKYMLYWSAGTGSTNTHPTYLYYIYTSDFKTFDGAPKRLINTGGNTIDGDITYNDADGLYYMYFKNEGTKPAIISYATATKPCGPYTSVQNSVSGAEGPQILQKADGSYVLFADNYGENAAPGGSKQGVFHAYSSNTINGFTSTETSTNIPYLYARHGSVVRISDNEYESLVNKFGVTSSTDAQFLFTGGTSATANGWIGSTKDPGGYIYKVHGFDDSVTQSYSAVNGTLTLNNKCVFIQGDVHTNIDTMLKSRNFTVSFKHTVTDRNKLSNEVPIVVIGNKTQDYIELYEDGTFIVGSSNVSINFTNTLNTEHEYTISVVKSTSDSTKATVILLIDDVYMGSAILSGDITDSSTSEKPYVVLGGCDLYTNCTVGTYKELVISPDTLNPNDYAVNCSSISQAISLFEQRINAIATNGYESLYTNISPAYELYKEAKSGNYTVSEADCLTKFNAALDNMKPFVEYSTGKNDPFADDPNFHMSSLYYSNVIYAEGATDVDDGHGGTKKAHAFSDHSSVEIVKSTNGGWVYGSYAYVYYPNTVLLYDGKTEPSLPVMSAFINKDHRYSVNMLYVAENLNDFALKNSKGGDYWEGYTDSQTFIWPYSIYTDTIPTDKNNTTEHDNAETINHNAENDRTTYRIHKHSMHYTATPSSAYTCYSSSSWDMKSQYTYLLDNIQIDNTLINNDADIVVIDYKKLTDALKSVSNSSEKKGWMAQLSTEYYEGGLEGLFNALDSATSLDPSSGNKYFEHVYDYANKAGADIEEPMDEAALLCGEDIDSSVHLLGDVHLTSYRANIKKLKASIANYERIMSNMTGVYTNLEAAYNAYLIAVEYVDAYEYGGRTQFTNPDLPTALDNLDEAILAMKPYSVPTITATNAIKYRQDVNNISSDYYQNIAYWGSTDGYTFVGSDSNKRKTASGFAVTIDKSDAYAYVTYPKTVLVYDGETGHTPKLPIFGAAHRTTTNHRYLYYLYPTTGDNSTAQNASFTLDQNWNGESNHDYTDKGSIWQPLSWNDAWNNTAGGGDAGSKGYSNITNSQLSGVTFIEGRGVNSLWNNYYYANIAATSMSYTGTGNTTNYYEDFTDLWWLGNLGSSYNPEEDDRWGKSTVPIYVVNYKPLKDKINGISISPTNNKLDVSNYTEGGLRTWFHQIDALTSFNPNTYFASANDSNVGTQVTSCATDIKNLVNSSVSTNPSQSGTSSNITTDTTNANTDDLYEDGELKNINDVSGGYAKLKVAILESEKVQKTQGCILDDVWADYYGVDSGNTHTNGALDNAKDAMSAISEGAIGSKYGYSDAQAGAIAQDLHDSITALYSASSSAHPLKYCYQENGTYNLYFQCNSNNSHVVDHDHDSTVISAVEEVGQAYITLASIYSTLDMSKYGSGSSATLAAGLATYNEVKTIAHPTNTAAMIEKTEQEKVDEIVDYGTRTLLNAIGEANAEVSEDEQNFTVNYNVYKIDGSGTETKVYTSSNEMKSYGQFFNVDISSNSAALSALGITSGDVNVTQIGISRNGGSEKRYVNTSGSNIASVFVDDSLTVNIYNKLPSQSSGHVTIKDISGNNYWTVDVTDNTTISYSSADPNTITIGGKAYSVPNTLSYNITGWSLLGGYYSVPASLDTTVAELISQSGDSSLTFRPAKEMKRPEKNSFTFTLDGTTVAQNVSYDYGLRLTTTKANAYAIVVYDNGTYIPVAYKANSSDTSITYKFYANRSLDFYTLCKVNNEYVIDIGNSETKTITNKDTIFYLNNMLPMVYSFADPVGDTSGTKTYYDMTVTYSNKWSTRSAFTTNVGGGSLGTVTITECGTLRTLSNLDESEFVVENVDGTNLKMIVNSKRSDESNQYSYTLGSSQNPAVAYTRAYVKYQYSYGGKEINAIAYGPICSSYYGSTPVSN